MYWSNALLAYSIFNMLYAVATVGLLTYLQH